MRHFSLLVLVSLFAIFCLLSRHAQVMAQKNEWCPTGTIWDGQKCEFCYKSDCTCQKYNECNGCKSGYGLVGQSTSDTTKRTCQACGYQALTCAFKNYFSSAQRSLSCLTDYKLFGHVCLQITNCKEYNDYFTCKECANHYYLDNMVCKRCDDANCIQCKGPQICQTCDLNYYLSKSGTQCLKCRESLYTCVDTDSNYIGCVDTTRYYFESKTCKLCKEKIEFCELCELTKSKSVSCTTCSAGYGLYYDSKSQITKCVAAVENCDVISSDDPLKCKSDGCKVKYYYSEGKCLACDATEGKVLRCKDTKYHYNCTQTAYSLSELGRINENNYLVENECIKNRYKCRLINKSTKKCDSCYYEYFYYKDENNECQLCSADISKACLQINPDAKTCQCKKCINDLDYTPGVQVYFLDTNKCTECKIECAQCTVASECKVCKKTYYQNVEKKECQKCEVDYCDKCDSTLKSCLTCSAGYMIYKQNNIPICVSCTPNCLECDSSDRKRCRTCMPMYSKYNDICIPYRSNCAEHNNDGSCKTCNHGFRNVEGWCVKCYSEGIDSQYLGYINCERGIEGKYYVRDGDSLTESFERRKNGAFRSMIFELSSLMIVLGMVLLHFV